MEKAKKLMINLDRNEKIPKKQFIQPNQIQILLKLIKINWKKILNVEEKNILFKKGK